MIINIDKGIWHIDCKASEWKSGIIKEIRHIEDRTLIECLHCGKKGHIKTGTPFKTEVCIDDA